MRLRSLPLPIAHALGSCYTWRPDVTSIPCLLPLLTAWRGSPCTFSPRETARSFATRGGSGSRSGPRSWPMSISPSDSWTAASPRRGIPWDRLRDPGRGRGWACVPPSRLEASLRVRPRGRPRLRHPPPPRLPERGHEPSDRHHGFLAVLVRLLQVPVAHLHGHRAHPPRAARHPYPARPAS